MTLHRALVWTRGEFLGAAVWLGAGRGEGEVLAAVAWAVVLVVGYRLAQTFVRGGGL